MKMTPEYTKAQANMQPGVLTSAGFLGDDSRPIVDIIAEDEATLQRVGLTFESLARRMHHLMNEGRKGLGEPTTVDDRWIVQVYEARGFLASPFEDGVFRKINAEVKLSEGGKPAGTAVLFSELSIHLVEKYHFLQGAGCPFRLDPVTVKHVLFPEL